MSMPAETHLSRLAEIVGPSNVNEDPSGLAKYEVDGSRPSMAVCPGTDSEAAEIVKYANREKLSLVACGARTKLAMGMPLRRYAMALDLSRLNHVVAYDPGDLTLSVEAGIPLSELARILSERGQFLPLAALFFRQATVGGTIASGVDTPLRQAYGTARDFILGMEFVTGQGTIAKSGGRVVKNVTGYDLHKLMIGSLGTLGVITKINFRTFPLPKTTRALVALFGSAEEALKMRDGIAQSPFSPLTLEVLSPRVAQLFTGETATRIEPKPFRPGILSADRWALTTGFSGNEAVLERYIAGLTDMAKKTGAQQISLIDESESAGALGRKREFVPIALASSPAAVILRLSVVPTKMHELLDKSASAAESNDLSWAAMARGVGAIYFALLPEAVDDQSRIRVVDACNKVLAAADSIGGNCTIPWCPAEWKPELKVWGAPSRDLFLMEKLKGVFDPNGVLSPGRFVGGL